ncbi:MAG: hypothetical protein Q4B28_07890 [bacterium]|nr:hypothetical protein [bacterium]
MKTNNHSTLLTPKEEQMYQAGYKAGKMKQQGNFIGGILVGLAIAIVLYFLMDLVRNGF